MFAWWSDGKAESARSARARPDAELLGPLGHRVAHGLDALGEVEPGLAPQLCGPRLNVLAADRGGQARLLPLLLDRLGAQSDDPVGTTVSAGSYEPRELVAADQRLVEDRLTRHAHVVGVREHGMDHLLRVLAPAKLLDGCAGVAALGIGKALVIEVVHERGDRPGLLVRAKALGIGA